jgi:hypothetical protein
VPPAVEVHRKCAAACTVLPDLSCTYCCCMEGPFHMTLFQPRPCAWQAQGAFMNLTWWVDGARRDASMCGRLVVTWVFGIARGVIM